jgi:hypothetical protein
MACFELLMCKCKQNILVSTAHRERRRRERQRALEKYRLSTLLTEKFCCFFSHIFALNPKLKSSGCSPGLAGGYKYVGLDIHPDMHKIRLSWLLDICRLRLGPVSEFDMDSGCAFMHIRLICILISGKNI